MRSMSADPHKQQILHCAAVGMTNYVDDFRDRFLETEAAVYGEKLAGDEVGSGGEEDGCGGHVVG